MTRSSNFVVNRRSVLKGVVGGAASLCAPSIWSAARASNVLTVGDGGGVYSSSYTEGYYKPFFKETGIEVVSIERRDNPVAELRAIVETKNYKWDLCGSIGQDVAHTLTQGGYLEELDVSGSDTEKIPESMRSTTFVGSDVGSLIVAYRADVLKDGITSPADFWDTTRFPGRRGLRNFARDSISFALVADGVAGKDVASVLSEESGWARAFKKLDEIKKDVKVWWTAGGQPAPLLQTGELDMTTCWNPRAQGIIDSGAPVKIAWQGGAYVTYGWTVPRGSPKADMARQFIKFCSNAERQAVANSLLSGGPTNPDAFQHMDSKRAESLPTFPENLKHLTPMDYKFWGPVQEKAATKFDEWLLG